MTFFTSQNELKTAGINKVFTAVLPQKCLKFFCLGLRYAPASENSRIVPVGEARKKRLLFSLFPIFGLSQGYSSYRLCHFHTYMWPFWMDTGLFSNRFLTFRSKSCTKKCFKPRQRSLKFKETCRFPIAASSKQSTPSKSLS